MKWFHQRPAGASNLLVGDLWGRRVVVTTSRGSGNTLAMAEYAVAGILHFAKGLHRAAVDRGAGVFDHRAYRPLLLEGNTACVVGAGGIGLDVGKLCAALGMGRRHPPPPVPRPALPPGFSAPSPVMSAPDDLPSYFHIQTFTDGPHRRVRMLAPERITVNGQPVGHE